MIAAKANVALLVPITPLQNVFVIYLTGHINNLIQDKCLSGSHCRVTPEGDGIQGILDAFLQNIDSV